ncbi:trypsin-like peptidase domain-containing protein [Paenibacillus larvae]|nr:trypsin-like peptidase domain-containing protein [Paenibacillus larvae]MDT2235682.1 trypsin-like peptidase domain-containing protein [Paenibacillus larvae]MDT2239735.1 trypsin-like peptidase domain-containing protein [Paenibacillus larvae]MDT2246382.1 trypsin-like peptidase domain-containing protein [Paenibacillus larvae]MDT2292953.1 trypsin-like peptidase domain-containing protein [Paenibacillus larvae]MDT2303813.1 trypsin-like peptidase domain-containing protein [Paenibacillus larvae]
MFERSDDKVHIVTNNHVIEGGNEFEVAIEHGEKKKAVVIGKDHISDLAVLEADGGGFSSIAEFGESNQVKTGETVIAVGNPLGLGKLLP